MPRMRVAHVCATRESTFSTCYHVCVTCLPHALQVGEDAVKIRGIANELKQQERVGGKTRKWRQQMKVLTQQMLSLEEEEQALLKVFPQVGASLRLCKRCACSAGIRKAGVWH